MPEKPKQPLVIARGIAHSIDNVIVLGSSFVLLFVLSSVITLPGVDVLSAMLSGEPMNATGISTTLAALTGLVVSAIVVVNLVSLIYYTYTLSGPSRATHGMRLMNLALVHVGGKSLPLPRVLFRNIFYTVMGIMGIQIINVFVMFFTKDGAMLHDLITETNIVYNTNNTYE